MITAEEAKKLTKNARNVDIEGIYKLIRESASNGDSSITINLNNNLHYVKFINEIIEKLKSDGFTATRDYFSDYRDSWDNLIIGW